MSNEKEVAPRTIAASDVRFSWAEGVSTPAYDRWYHWLVDCPELRVATWYGAKVVSSDAPPPDAGDVDDVKGFLEKHLGSLDWPNAIVRPRGEPPKPGLRWLCRICDQFLPHAVAAPAHPSWSPARSAAAPGRCTSASAGHSIAAVRWAGWTCFATRMERSCQRQWSTARAMATRHPRRAAVDLVGLRRGWARVARRLRWSHRANSRTRRARRRPVHRDGRQEGRTRDD